MPQVLDARQCQVASYGLQSQVVSTSLRTNLALKTLLLSAVAVIAVTALALTITWKRFTDLVDQRPLQQAGDLAQAIQRGQVKLPPATGLNAEQTISEIEPIIIESGTSQVRYWIVEYEAARIASEKDALMAATLANALPSDPGRVWSWQKPGDGARYFRYMTTLRIDQADLLDDDTNQLNNSLNEPTQEPTSSVLIDASNDMDQSNESGISQQDRIALDSEAADAPKRPEMATGLVTFEPDVLVIEVQDEGLDHAIVVNRIYTISAGLTAALVAMALLWVGLKHLVMTPVKTLHHYANRAESGERSLRCDINTGDEFEQLAQLLNKLMAALKNKEDQLAIANKSLDLKLGELAESNTALDQANQVKNEFLANVSHELRTPLNSIIGFGEILQETLPPAVDGDKMSQKRHRYVTNMITASRRLLDLITDILDLAKIEAGRMSLNVSSVSVSDTSEGLINLMKPEAAKRGVKLKLRIEAGLPVIQTDAGKLQQILFNFLSNATKFTPSGGQVVLAAALLPSYADDRPDEIRFTVEDSGPGIAPEDFEKVFEKFNQLDPSVTREHGGTGLGLAISKQLSDMLQGRIDVDSVLGQGAIFSLTIPVAPKARADVLMPELVDQ